MNNLHKALALSMLGAATLPSVAADFTLGEGIEGKFDTTLTLGTQIRMDKPSPDAYSKSVGAGGVSSVVPGTPPGHLAGQQGGSDLNYGQGNPISTVAKAAFDLDLKKDNLGVFVRANVWHDFVQGQSNAAYGNYANGFSANTPLGDSGFADSAKFSSTELRDYYAYGKFDLAEGKTVDGKLGRQVLQWGGSQFVTGGINSAINPPDYASQLRPGALPSDSKLPLGMVSAKLATGTAWNLEGFLPYEFRGAVLPGCGSYFDVTSYAPHGCAFASLAGATEKANLNANAYLHRNDDINASDSGQFGLSAGYKSDDLNTDLRAYALNTHNSAPLIRMSVNSTAGGVLAANYAVAYAENVALYGLSFNTKLNSTANVFGEVAYRPSQPIGLNAYDVVLAFAARTGAVARNKGTNALPVGATFNAYDNFGVVTASLGTNKVFPKALGAERVMLVGEIGLSHVNDLPDTSVLRYGRALPYAGAAYAGGPACNPAAPGSTTDKTCTTDGYVTSDAWGLRLLMSASYPNAMAGATVTPSLLVVQDVMGYSYDGTFSQGRSTARAGLRMDWSKSYYLDLQYTLFSGGNYNLAVDRSYLSLTAGARF